MIALGINSVYHESSAALVVDGRVVAAAEEERFNRVKHGKPARVDNPHELPAHAIAFCLGQAGIRPRDVDAFCYSFDPALRAAEFHPDPISEPGGWGDAAGEATFRAALVCLPDRLSDLLGEDARDRFHWVPHHLAHAVSAFYPSGFDEAAVLVVDGIAEHASILMAHGRGTTLRTLGQCCYPDSLGFLWEKVCKYLGFSEYDACKVMGLAAYGAAETQTAAFARLASLNGRFSVDPRVAQFRQDRFDGLERVFGMPRRNGEPLSDRHRALAAALQEYTDRVMLHLAERLHRLCPSENLCLAGGVALNCVSNWVVKERGPFRNVYIPPAPHDAGTAVGAALHVGRSLGQGMDASPPTSGAYSGPDFSDSAIETALCAGGLQGHRVPDAAGCAAQLVAGGGVVGWFQGRMEFGPRALGNRSLLADPRTRETREHLNRKIKHREEFRPFGPSVLAERAADWFELGRPSRSFDYMLYACPVKPERRAAIPAVVHADGTARIQTVRRESNPGFHRLIECFERRTGIPVVLNTSFNDSEPIVCTPADAVNTFKQTRIDALVLGDYLVER